VPKRGGEGTRHLHNLLMQHQPGTDFEIGVEVAMR
jgi:hypothetical protein